jgi:hypothetical protein
MSSCRCSSNRSLGDAQYPAKKHFEDARVGLKDAQRALQAAHDLYNQRDLHSAESALAEFKDLLAVIQKNVVPELAWHMRNAR